jgi:hypothetical protein
MRNFLAQPDAVLYHITTRENWELIKQSALYANSEGRIFVSRYDHVGILFSIVVSQLVGLEEDVDFVVLRLPQALNIFDARELSLDFQATEPTMPVQNILYRKEIPLSNIEFLRPIKTTVTEIGTAANQLEADLPGLPIFHESLAVIYETPNRRQYVVDADKPGSIWKFTQRFL